MALDPEWKGKAEEKFLLEEEPKEEKKYLHNLTLKWLNSKA